MKDCAHLHRIWFAGLTREFIHSRRIDSLTPDMTHSHEGLRTLQQDVIRRTTATREFIHSRRNDPFTPDMTHLWDMTHSHERLDTLTQNVVHKTSERIHTHTQKWLTHETWLIHMRDFAHLNRIWFAGLTREFIHSHRNDSFTPDMTHLWDMTHSHERLDTLTQNVIRRTSERIHTHTQKWLIHTRHDSLTRHDSFSWRTAHTYTEYGSQD